LVYNVKEKFKNRRCVESVFYRKDFLILWVMKNIIINSLQSAAEAIEQLLLPKNVEFIEKCANLLTKCFESKNKLIIAGNGGSLCDAMHFAEELTGQFRKKRAALPAIALCEPGHLTCVSNDMGFSEVFSRGVEAYGMPGDVFIGLTTSGNSENIVRAFQEAKKKGLQTVAFLGKSGGKLRGVADLEIIIEGFSTSDRIQEAHMAAIHIIIEALEQKMFYQKDLCCSDSSSC
jgi:D-sedoheptulose 7-phosphate isomerase